MRTRRNGRTKPCSYLFAEIHQLPRSRANLTFAAPFVQSWSHDHPVGSLASGPPTCCEPH